MKNITEFKAAMRVGSLWEVVTPSWKKPFTYTCTVSNGDSFVINNKEKRLQGWSCFPRADEIKFTDGGKTAIFYTTLEKFGIKSKREDARFTLLETISK